MAHVVNFSPMPSSAIAAQLTDLDVEVISVHDVDDDVEACRGAVVAIADFSGDRRITIGHAVALAKTCKLVVVPATSIESIDLRALHDVGIPVATARGLNAVPVAEWAIWATITGLRRLSEHDLGLREGRCERFGSRYELNGKRVLIVGMGPIGQEVAKRLRPFGVHVDYWTRTRRDETFEDELGLSWADLDLGLKQADVIILCIALSEHTHHLLGVARLQSLRTSAVLVNAGRAELIDQEALVAALDQEHVHAYVTDVFEVEPPAVDDPVLVASTMATPHIAGVTVESVGRILGQTIENVNRILRDEEPLGLLEVE